MIEQYCLGEETSKSVAVAPLSNQDTSISHVQDKKTGVLFELYDTIFCRALKMFSY